MHEREFCASPSRTSSWLYVGLLALGFAGLYVLNFLLPLNRGSYTTRIWNWAEWSLAAGALAVLAFRWRSIRLRPALIGAGLSLLSGASRWAHAPSLSDGIVEGVAVWLTFVAGTILFAGLGNQGVRAFQDRLVRSLGIGTLFALPLALVNNLYFYLQDGGPRFQNVLLSAFEALSPGIHEEAVYRYFVLAICLALLKDSPHRRWVWTTAIALAVIPHSLLHLPDLFLQNPAMGVVMLVATSLLFGLPMALLQVKRSFESAVAFHWFIDFARFVFGY